MKAQYTIDGRHPDDVIYETKNFINELSNVQEQYFEKLVEALQLTSEGETWLFDYIYNSGEEGKYLTFDEHLSFYKKSMQDFLKPQE
jgi:antirestriction protein